jgi:glycine dehydrogenase subunit 1
VNPVYIDVCTTYARYQGIEFELVDLADQVTDFNSLKSKLDDSIAAVVVQNPNFYGDLEDLSEIKTQFTDSQIQLIAVVNPISLSILEAPGKQGADITVGEGQSLGNHMGFGGPYLGFMAVKEPLIRKVPGRIAGESIDVNGKRAYVMVLRTREQDIRRERATSNICTNQGLNALAACIYMSALGKNGLRRVAELCAQKAHYLAEEINRIDGFQVLNKNFFNEFQLEIPIPSKDLIRGATEAGFFAGVDLSRFNDSSKNRVLLAVTEKRSKAEMDAFVAFMKGFVQ